MSVQSDAAKAHIGKLMMEAYPNPSIFGVTCMWFPEYPFDKRRKWRFDYAVPSIHCAIELDGGTFQSIRTGHASGAGLRAWREKNNAAMSQGWRVWHYAPDEVIKAGRKIVEGFGTKNSAFFLRKESIYVFPETIRNPA